MEEILHAYTRIVIIIGEEAHDEACTFIHMKYINSTFKLENVDKYHTMNRGAMNMNKSTD